MDIQLRQLVEQLLQLAVLDELEYRQLGLGLTHFPFVSVRPAIQEIQESELAHVAH